jgi:hypothetical protein
MPRRKLHRTGNVVIVDPGRAIAPPPLVKFHLLELKLNCRTQVCRKDTIIDQQFLVVSVKHSQSVNVRIGQSTDRVAALQPHWEAMFVTGCVPDHTVHC